MVRRAVAVTLVAAVLAGCSTGEGSSTSSSSRTEPTAGAAAASTVDPAQKETAKPYLDPLGLTMVAEDNMPGYRVHNHGRVLVVGNSSQATLNRIAQKAGDASYDAEDGWPDLKVPHMLVVLVPKDAAAYHRLVNDRRLSKDTWTRWSRGALAVHGAKVPDDAAVQRDLVYEILSGVTWTGPASHPSNVWLTNGILEYHTDKVLKSGTTVPEQARWVRVTRSMVTTGLPPNRQNDDAAWFSGWALAHYIARTFGEVKLRRLYAIQQEQSLTPDEAVAPLGISAAELDRRFLAWVRPQLPEHVDPKTGSTVPDA